MFSFIKKIQINKYDYTRIIIFVKALLASAAVTIYSGIEMYNIIPVFLFFAFVCLFKYCNNNIQKKQRILQICLSILFSLILIVGKSVDTYKFDFNVCGIIKAFGEYNLIAFVGFCFIISSLIELIFKFLDGFDFSEERILKLSNKKVFVISFVIIMICWFPYFLNYYPGIVNSDTVGEYGMAAGVEHLSDHHPIVHAMFIGMFYNLGFSIFKSGTAGVAFSTFAQMIIMAAIFAYFILFLYKHKINFKLIILFLLFFVIFPVNAFFAITTWKDTLFSGMFLLLNVFVFEMLERGKNVKIKDFVFFVLISLAMLFFRNNGIYVYLLWIPFLILLFNNFRKTMVILCVFVVSFYFVVKGPVFSKLNVYNTSSAESLSIPMQQIGYIVSKNLDLTKSEKAQINEIIDIKILKRVYNPTISDTIKFDPAFNIGPFNKDKIKYLKLWLSLIAKHPMSATEAYMNITLGFWYPNLFYSVVPTELVSTNSLGIKRYNICPPGLREFISSVEPNSRKVTLFNLQWNGAICFWILLICMTYACLANGKKNLAFYVPIFGIWFTMMIATPVYVSFRYIYGMFISIPYMFILPYLYKNFILKKEG